MHASPSRKEARQIRTPWPVPLRGQGRGLAHHPPADLGHRHGRPQIAAFIRASRPHGSTGRSASKQASPGAYHLTATCEELSDSCLAPPSSLPLASLSRTGRSGAVRPAQWLSPWHVVRLCADGSSAPTTFCVSPLAFPLHTLSTQQSAGLRQADWPRLTGWPVGCRKGGTALRRRISRT